MIVFSMILAVIVRMYISYDSISSFLSGGKSFAPKETNWLR